MESFLCTILLCSLSMSFLAIFYLVITQQLLKHYRVKWCYYAWLIIIVGFIFPFRLHIGSSLVKIPLPMQYVTGTEIEEFLISSVPTQNWIESVAPPFGSISVWNILAAIWVLGIIVFFSYHVIRHNRFMVTVRRWSDEITDTQTLSVFLNAKKHTGIRGKVGIKICHCVYTPMLIGLTRPYILLPDNNYTLEELAIILKHELIHLKHKDLLYRVLVIIAMGIHWFNPFLHFVAKEIAFLCELSCDDEVVRGCDLDIRKQYGKTILCSAKKIQAQTAFSTGFAGDQRNMRRRIATIMDSSKKRTGFVIVCVLLIFVFGAGLIISITEASAESETLVNYIDETFMKERVLSGAASGDFKTDGYIVYPEDSDTTRVPLKPEENKDSYSDFAVGAYIIELRYRYPFGMTKEDESGREYTTQVNFDYDFVLSDNIEYQELNTLIGSYLTTFKDIFENASFEELVREGGVYLMAEQCKEYVDNNADLRVHFRFYLSGISGDAPIASEVRMGELNTFN